MSKLTYEAAFGPEPDDVKPGVYKVVFLGCHIDHDDPKYLYHIFQFLDGVYKDKHFDIPFPNFCLPEWRTKPYPSDYYWFLSALAGEDLDIRKMGLIHVSGFAGNQYYCTVSYNYLQEIRASFKKVGGAK